MVLKKEFISSTQNVKSCYFARTWYNGIKRIQERIPYQISKTGRASGGRTPDTSYKQTGETDMGKLTMDTARKLMAEHVHAPNLIEHSLAVSAAMGAMAGHFG